MAEKETMTTQTTEKRPSLVRSKSLLDSAKAIRAIIAAPLSEKRMVTMAQSEINALWAVVDKLESNAGNDDSEGSEE